MKPKIYFLHLFLSGLCLLLFPLPAAERAILSPFEGPADLAEDRTGLTDIFMTDLKEAGFTVTMADPSNTATVGNTTLVGGKLGRFGGQIVWTVNALNGDKSFTRRENSAKVDDFLKTSKAWAQDLWRAMAPAAVGQANVPPVRGERVPGRNAAATNGGTNLPPPAITVELPFPEGVPWGETPLSIQTLIKTLGQPLVSNTEWIWFDKGGFGKSPPFFVTATKGVVKSLQLTGSDLSIQKGGPVFGFLKTPWHGTWRPTFAEMEGALKSIPQWTVKIDKNTSDYQGYRIFISHTNKAAGWGQVLFDRGQRLDSIIWRWP